MNQPHISTSDNVDQLFDVYCKAYSVSEFNDTFENNRNDFSISHINVRSLKKYFDDFQLLYESCLQAEFNVIAVSEIWQISDKKKCTACQTIHLKPNVGKRIVVEGWECISIIVLIITYYTIYQSAMPNQCGLKIFVIERNI